MAEGVIGVGLYAPRGKRSDLNSQAEKVGCEFAVDSSRRGARVAAFW